MDAEPEHEESKFYVWTQDELKATLSAEEFGLVAPHYGLDARPNFEHQFWPLRVVQPLADVAQRLGLAPEHAQTLLDAAREKLLTAREKRVRPGRDEKILVSWNALMAKGMAHAARIFDKPE